MNIKREDKYSSNHDDHPQILRHTRNFWWKYLTPLYMKIKQQIFVANEPLTFPFEILGISFFFLNDDTILKKKNVSFLFKNKK
jgi:hypothetical protein